MTDLQRGEYPALAASMSPNSAVALLNDRVQTISKTNRDVADWLQERRRVEDAYVQSLRKLSRREPPDVTNDDLGIFLPAWQRIVGGVASLADSHSTFAKRIETDVERPLRDFMTGSREMQQLSTVTGNLSSLAKEYSNAQKKAEKARAGGAAGSNKLSNANEDVETALAQWESQAPYVFENLQAVDESRLNQLRDVLTQMQTHEVDQVEKNRASAESSLQALLSINTSDEIQAFTAKNAGAERIESRAERPASSQRDRTHERRSSRFIPTLGSSQQNSSAYSAMNGGDADEEPDVSRDSTNTPATPATEEKKPKGLRRLGTVFSRKNRQSVMGRPTPGRGKSSNQRLGSSADLAEDPIAEAESSISRERSNDPPQQSPRPPRSSSIRGANGTTSDRAPQLAAPAPAGASLMIPDTISSSSQQPIQPVPAVQTAQTFTASPPQQSFATAPAPIQTSTQRPLSIQPSEAEVFSTPPTSATLDPIAQAQREAAEAGDFGVDAANRPYNLDIRNAPISEEGTAANDQAMASVASTLRASAAPPARRQGTVRGRRDVRNTVYVPSDTAAQFDSYQAGSAPTVQTSTTAPPAAVAASPSTVSPIVPIAAGTGLTGAAAPVAAHAVQPAHRTFGSEDHTSDNQSVRSGRSMASSTAALGASATSKHADSSIPGLTSSIVETVSATLENGGIVHSGVQGELALSYNPPDGQAIPASAKETIRLENFQTLDKVAPNPGFVSERTAGSGEYVIDLQSLALQTGQPVHLAHGKPAIAFKYKLHADPSDAMALTRPCPIILAPSWKHEQNQTSVILTYSLNPAFAAAQTGQLTELTLHNVFLVLHLTGAKASSVQSKPAGTFSKRENLIYWRFEELTLAAGTATQKAIARFATDGLASGGRVEARWEVVSPNAVTHAGALGVSRLGGGDPFADETSGSFTAITGARKLVSGSYVAT